MVLNIFFDSNTIYKSFIPILSDAIESKKKIKKCEKIQYSI